jgi:plastocyanin
VGPLPAGTETVALGKDALVISKCLWSSTARALVLIIPLLWTSIDMSALSAQETGQRIAVEVGDNYYKPEVIRVKAGDSIVFSNQGKQLHSLTLVDHEELLNEAYLDPGKTFTFVVPNGLQPGLYILGCNIHVEMQGRLVVER